MSGPHLLHIVVVIAAALFAAPDYLSVKVFAARPPTVHIKKCCRVGEYLDRSQSCVVGSTDKWAPLVYMIGQDRPFERRGEFPRFFKIEENTRPTTCVDFEYFSNDLVVFSNGSLFLFQKKQHLPPSDYCVDKNAVLVCLPRGPEMDSMTAPKRLAHVRKCCGPHSAYDEVRKDCEFFSNSEHPLFDADVVNSTSVETIFGFPECTDGHFVIAGVFESEYLNVDNGTLTLTSGPELGANNFCLEHTIRSNLTNSSIIKMFACTDQLGNGLVNREPTRQQPADIRFALYSAGLLISVLFLSATLATGFIVPTSHHVLHWKCQMYYIACLLVGDLLLAISQISGHINHVGTCVTLATAMHFFFLAAFFWLNTMCFNIWWTFRDLRPTSLEKNQEVWRLRLYSVYAWGVPLIIVSVGAILDNIPNTSGEQNFLRPRFSEESCWFYGDLEIFAYFFGPIGALLCVNLLLFASTARQLTCGLWKLDDVKSSTEKTVLGRVCLKLVVVMGITWIADIISWLVGGPQSVWYVTDLINALQGVFIFIVVGCQPQVWLAIKRLWNSKSGQCNTTMTNDPQHSSSSQGLPSLGDSVTNHSVTATTTSTAISSPKVGIPMETVC